MKRCKRCAMTDTRPGISFSEDGICLPCKRYLDRGNIDWVDRFNQLDDLCNRHKNNHFGKYDCIITVSGGKDSTYQLYLFKKLLEMNPLCVMVDNNSWTETGVKNFYNMSDEFGVDILRLTPNRKAGRILARKGFLDALKPNIYWDRVLYVWPLQIAQQMGISLVIWGENTNWECGGPIKEETPNALTQLDNGIIDPAPLYEWCIEGITIEDLQPCIFPSLKDLEKLEVIFTSYYVPWSRITNVKIAKDHGFQDLNDTGEWVRTGLEDFPFEQVDSIGYLVNNYCKYIKFGLGEVTELVAHLTREGVMSRNIAMEYIKRDEGKLDPIMLKDFCQWLGITKQQFWNVIDRFANRELLYKDALDGLWKLKEFLGGDTPENTEV